MNPRAQDLSSAGRQFLDRRRFLSGSASSLGAIALASLLGRDGLLRADGGARSASPVIGPGRPFAPPPTSLSRQWVPSGCATITQLPGSAIALTNERTATSFHFS